MSVAAFSIWNALTDFVFDPNLDNKILIKSSYLTPAICLTYYFGISYLGPYLMKNRTPFRLENLIMLYNFALVAFNFHIAYGILHGVVYNEVFLESLCPSDVRGQVTKVLKILGPYPWYFFLSKMIELADSVFFVLRKRFDLLTVLHRFHHAMTPMAAWYILHTDLNFCLLLGVILNSIVHVVMYFYYGLAACGPRLKKHLWWKKYLTTFQILQIASVILCVLTNAATGCFAIKAGEIVLLCLCIFVLILFVNYFHQQYSAPGSNFVPRFSSTSTR